MLCSNSSVKTSSCSTNLLFKDTVKWSRSQISFLPFNMPKRNPDTPNPGFKGLALTFLAPSPAILFSSWVFSSQLFWASCDFPVSRSPYTPLILLENCFSFKAQLNCHLHGVLPDSHRQKLIALASVLIVFVFASSISCYIIIC